MGKQAQRIHPAVKEMQLSLQKGKVSRREFLKLATLLGVSFTTAQFMAGCGPQEQSGPPPVNYGGTLKIGSAFQPIKHPAQLSWIEGSNQIRQVAEYLTETGPDNITRPWLLEKWEASNDVKTWTLYLRKDIKFNDGTDLTAKDVIFNFHQWLDPEIDSSMRGLLSYLDKNNIEKVDDYTIKLHLNEPQIGVPEHLYHYPAVIMPHTFEGDFLKQPIGTGPFELVEYEDENQSVFKKREEYWRKDKYGRPLPYLDKLIYIHLLGAEARVEAMQGRLIDTMFLPSAVDWRSLKATPGLTVYSVRSSRTTVLRMKVNEEPWKDVLVRQALKYCQDRQALLEISYANQGVLGMDAHVAPVHPAYWEPPELPAYDPERSRALLAEAGYPDGIQAKLVTKNDQGEPEFARAFQKMAAAGGFELDLDIIESRKYWERWTEVNLGVTIWGHRPLGTMALALGYGVDEKGEPISWNETHWVDEEFLKILQEAERTLDIPARRKLMKKLQTIMQERGPIGISYWRDQWAIARAEFKNIRAHPAGFDLFYDVWKE